VIGRLAQSRFLAPCAHDAIRARIFPNWDALVRQIRELKQQIILRCLSTRASCAKFNDLIANLPDVFLQLVCCFAACSFCPDVLAQAVSIGVQLLERRFHFPAFRVDTQDFVDFALIAAAARGKPLTHKIGFLSDQTNVEHGAVGMMNDE
jgi:hypothetical protein